MARHEQVIFGIHPVMEAIGGDEPAIRRIIIAEGRHDKAVRELMERAKEKHIPCQFQSRIDLERMAGGQSHQGIVAVCRRFSYAGLAEVIGNRHPVFDNDVIMLLDGIQDPRNLGSLIRTAHCLGVNGVIVAENRTASLTGTAMKASAGAVYHVPIARVVNVARTIDELKERGFWIYGATPEGKRMFEAFDCSQSIGLLFGSEGEGIRPLLRKKCDFLVSIPMWGKIDSLNVSVAAGIVLYEATRGRMPDRELSYP
jgi:23S rRNA (guanosine2251-2'-O)-methyltransferase